jgi:hypothetical protein
MLGFLPQLLQKSRLEPVIKELLALGLSPIPVVPVQHNQGFKVINGKSPSYFENGKPKLLAHKQGGLHDRLPSQAELETWLSDSRVGIGSFGSPDGLTDLEHCDLLTTFLVATLRLEGGEAHV